MLFAFSALRLKQRFVIRSLLGQGGTRAASQRTVNEVAARRLSARGARKAHALDCGDTDE